MPRSVTYEVADRTDGRFDVLVTMEPGKVFSREGLTTRAEADEWVDGLRILMAACGAPVSRVDAESHGTACKPAHSSGSLAQGDGGSAQAMWRRLSASRE